MIKNKQKSLELLKQKINGEIKITYSKISEQTGYGKRQLIKFSQEVEKKDIDELLIHGLTGKNSNNSVPTKKLNILKNSKINIRILVYHNLEIFIMKMLFGTKKKNMMSKNII